MKEGDFLDLHLEQQGTDLELRLLDPEGRDLLRVDSPNGPLGPEILIWKAEVTGPHRLELLAHGEEEPPRYVLRYPPPRPATEEEENLARGFRRLREAMVLEDPQKSRSLLEDLPKFWLEQERPLLAARTLGILGTLTARRDLAAAVDPYEQALPLLRRQDPGWELLRQLLSCASLHRQIGEPVKARQHLEEALALAENRLDDPRARATVFNDLGLLEDLVGRAAEALELYDQALTIWRDLGAESAEAVTLQNLGVLYSRLGRSADALDHLGRALALARRLGVRGDQLAATVAALASELETIDPARASELYFEAVNLQKGNPRGRAIALGDLGRFQLQRGKASAAVENLNRALGLVEGTRDLLEALLLERLAAAEVALATGNERPSRLRRARRHLQRALDLLPREVTPHNRAGTLTALARVEHRRGHRKVAQIYLDEALDLIEDGRANLLSSDLRSAFFYRHRMVLDALVDLLLELHWDEKGAGYAARAFEIAERAKGRGLLDAVAGVDWRRRLPPDLAERERELRERLAIQKATELGHLTRGEPEAARLAAEKRRPTEEAYRQLEAEIRSRLGLNIRPEPLDSERIRSLLPADTLMLSVHWSRDRVLLFEVHPLAGPRGVIPHILPGGGAFAKESIRTLQNLLSETHPDQLEITEARTAHLAHKLLTPLLPALESETLERLVFVPDGLLTGIPLSVLPWPSLQSTDDRSYLLERFEILRIPSASLLDALAQRNLCQPKKELSLFFDPVFRLDDPRSAKSPTPLPMPPTFGVGRGLRSPEELERIPFSRLEAEALLRLLPDAPIHVAEGFEANRDAVLGGALGQARLVHLATHGLLDPLHPELSGLVFSRFDRQGQPRAAFLRPRDIAALDLCAELVVLSACRTALGEETRGAGLQSLTHAFFLAGTRRLMASYWDVNDAATAELMTRFYEAHLRLGLPAAAALRHAQLGLLRETSWSHPGHWGAFAVQGDWQ